MDKLFGSGSKTSAKDEEKGTFGSTFGKKEDKGMVDETIQDIEDGCSLTWEQRFWGFVVCIGVGTVFGILVRTS